MKHEELGDDDSGTSNVTTHKLEYKMLAENLIF